MAYSERILGLDFGTLLGWAVLDGPARVASSRVRLLPNQHVHRGQRWLHFELTLTSLVKEYNPDLIAFERVRNHAGVGAAHIYGGWLAMLELFQTRRLLEGHATVEELAVEVSTWKHITTGNGKASKQEVRDTMDLHFNMTAGSEDESDALAIAEAARRMRQLHE